MGKHFGYTGKILRIDLTERESQVHDLEKGLPPMFLGGRGFNSKRLYDEVGPDTDPLGSDNKLFFSTGPLVGTTFPTASRFNVSAMSPQTGILGDTNAGGHFAPELKYAGFDQMVLEGRSKELLYLFVDDSNVEFRDASHLAGLDIYEADEAIKVDIGDRRVQTAVVGPAAENGVRFCGISVNLMRAAARTGMGTVMASKGVKAVTVRGTGSVEVAHPGRFDRLVDEIAEMIYSHEQYWPRRRMGTTRILKMADEAGFLPTRHYTAGVFEHANEVSGERLAEEFNVKTRGCFSCTIPCSRFYVVREGRFAGLYGEGPEYEAQGSFTARVGNSDLGLALKAIDACNKLGMDALSVSEGISWAMELHERGMLSSQEADGLDMSWGNGDTILALIEKMARREGFGDILADGAKEAARKLGRGLELTMQVKGLDLIMADPRGLKGFGLGYAVASRGGDHLRSEPFLELSDDPSMEPCKNIMQNMEILTFDRASQVIEAATGMKMTPGEVRRVGERIINIERAYNVRLGLRRVDDHLPRRFSEEPLTEGASSGTTYKQDVMLDEYYTERDWDLETGIPGAVKLKKLGLGYIADEFRERGLTK